MEGEPQHDHGGEIVLGRFLCNFEVETSFTGINYAVFDTTLTNTPFNEGQLLMQEDIGIRKQNPCSWMRLKVKKGQDGGEKFHRLFIPGFKLVTMKGVGGKQG